MKIFDHKKIIGIIGGAGVAAGVEIVSRFEKKVTMMGAYRDQHHPQVVLYQATQAPSRSLYYERNGESFIPEYKNIIQKLTDLGAQTIGMACNTAHSAFDELSTDIRPNLIHMIKDTALFINNKYNSKRKIGILCSDGARKVKLFESNFKTIGLAERIVFPSDKFQHFITQGIIALKSGAHYKNELGIQIINKFYQDVMNHLINEQRAELLLIGCTDISVTFKYDIFNSVPVIDSMDILVEKCLEEVTLNIGESSEQ